ncbi:hypothetical protein B1A99_26735 [Cohnella sp. CIP 111063]|nr:hypothetical protein B1A99_26735 [Cohnella sp. CIP 111063]
MINEIFGVFSGEGKDSLLQENLDFELLWDTTLGRYKYKKYIISILEDLLVHRSYTFDEVVAEINGWDYNTFVLLQIYELLNNNSEVILTEQQSQIISSICYEMLDRVSFRNAIKYQEQNETIPIITISLWYIRQRLNLDYPESVLLDLLSFDYHYHRHDYLGTSYIEDRVESEKISARVLENLEQYSIKGRVLINHLQYCLKHHLSSGTNVIKKYLEDNTAESAERILAFEVLLSYGIDDHYLITVMKSTTDFEVFFKIGKHLFAVGNDTVESLLMQYVNEDSRYTVNSAYLLMERQNMQGIKYFCNHFEKFDSYYFEHRPLSLIRTVEALPVLFELLNKAMVNHLQTDRFRRLDVEILNVMTHIALQGKTELQTVLSSLLDFIDRNPTIPNIQFLHVSYDDILNSYKTNTPGHHYVESALRTANNLLHVPINEEYQEKLVLSVKLQKDIIEKCKANSLPDIYVSELNMIVNATNLVRMTLSRERSQFETFINHLQQLFYEPIFKERRAPASHIQSQYPELLAVIDRIRCIRHYYLHSKLSDPEVRRIVEEEFQQLGGEPITPDQWTSFHVRLTEDLLEALKQTESKL